MTNLQKNITLTSYIHLKGKIEIGKPMEMIYWRLDVVNCLGWRGIVHDMFNHYCMVWGVVSLWIMI